MNSAEAQEAGHISVGVRYDVSDRLVIQQFHEAFDFWARLLDAEFYDEPSTSCAIAIVNGMPSVLNGSTIVARAQFPDRQNFQGWIAVKPAVDTVLSNNDAIITWIHEIGHLLGLRHNQSADSVMYAIDGDAKGKLDSADLRALAALHAFRPISPLSHSKAQLWAARR